MGKIIAILLIAAGLGGGLVAGTALRPDKLPEDAESAKEVGYSDGKDGGKAASADGTDGYGKGDKAETGGADGKGSSADHEGSPPGEYDESPADRGYIQIGRQIIIPVVDGGETKALMMFDLALDVPTGLSEQVYGAEPRLRDAFLRILFQMSYTGAFSAAYTDERVIAELRGKLRRAARSLLGDEVAEVLILDLMRQEF